MPEPLSLFDRHPVRRSRRASEDDEPSARRLLSVVEKVRRSAQARSRLAMFLGALLGMFVPCATYAIAHYEVAGRPVLWVLVLGGLLFSASTVYDFGKAAFGSVAKAAGFVVLIEGCMVLSGLDVLARSALALLAGINAVATGVALALEHETYTAGSRRRRGRR